MYPDWFSYIHVGLFFVSAVVAFGIALVCGRDSEKRMVFKIALGNAVPLFVTSLTYLIVYENFSSPQLRWLGYTVACGFFAYETALTMKREQLRAVFSGILMSVTLFTGFIVYVLQETRNEWFMFAIGSVTYVASLLLLAFDREFRLPEGTPRRLYLAFFVLVWSVYPFVFAFGPAGIKLYGRRTEALGYFVMEFFAKYAVAAINIYFAFEKAETRRNLRT